MGRVVPAGAATVSGLTSFLLARRCTLGRSVPCSVDLARGSRSCTHSCEQEHLLSATRHPQVPPACQTPPRRGCSPSHPLDPARAGRWPWWSPAPSSSSPAAPTGQGIASGASARAHQHPAHPRQGWDPATPAPPTPSSTCPLALPASGGVEPCKPGGRTRPETPKAPASPIRGMTRHLGPPATPNRGGGAPLPKGKGDFPTPFRPPQPLGWQCHHPPSASSATGWWR